MIKERGSRIDVRDVPECTTCGACCFSRSEEYLRVLGVDYERLGEDADRWVHFLGHRAYMKMVDGHCGALYYEAEKGLFLCAVYDRRPDVCRWLERGSGHCAGERHEKAERPVALRRKTTGAD